MAIDAELVEQIRRGNREAYGELFRKYYAQIYSLCLSILNNPQDAEEIAQEMFIHAYLKLDGLRKSDSFFPWLKKMARNRSRDFVRQAARRKTPLSLADEHTSAASPADKLLRQELMDSIIAAIETLPVKDREVIQARIDGLDHAEISKRFGISVEASMTRLSRARRKLAGHLKGLYSVFGLSKILTISGGVVAMKIGTGAKVTIGVIGVLTVGFIGFQIATRESDHEMLPSNQAIQGTSAKSSEKLEASQQAEDKKKTQVQAESTTASSDSSKESVTEEEAKEFVAFLDQLDNQEDSEETVDPKEKPSSGLTPERRAKLETAIAIVEDEIKTEVAGLIAIGDEMAEYLQSRGENPASDSADKWDWYVKTDREVQEKWTELNDMKVTEYVSIGLVLEGRSFRHPLATGGWLYDMAQRLPENMVPRSVSGNGFIDRLPDKAFR